MKVKPYFVRLADTYILGPCVSFEMGETRAGLSLVKFEVGLAFESTREYGFGCHRCGAIGHAKIDHLPEGWVKKYRKAPGPVTYYFLCGECAKKPRKAYTKLVIE